MQMQYYTDDPSVYATVRVGDREIKVRASVESEAFLESVLALDDAKEILGVSVWLAQMSAFLRDCPEKVINNHGVTFTVCGRVVVPYTTGQGLRLMRSLSRVEDRDQRCAVATFLGCLGEECMHRAANMVPDLVTE